MDTPDEARDYDSMDHQQVNCAFVADLLAFAARCGLNWTDVETSPESEIVWAECLDLGTGTAQIPIELCRQSPLVRVMAVDAAPSMLDLAKNNLEIASLTDRILLDLADAKRLPYADGRFMAAISNSIVHHIPEPIHALAEAVRVTAPGGLLFVRDLLRPVDEARVGSLVETYAAGANLQQRAMFEASLRAALDLDEIRALVTDLGFAAENVTATSDRHWTWAAQKPLV